MYVTYVRLIGRFYVEIWRRAPVDEWEGLEPWESVWIVPGTVSADT